MSRRRARTRRAPNRSVVPGWAARCAALPAVVVLLMSLACSVVPAPARAGPVIVSAVPALATRPIRLQFADSIGQLSLVDLEGLWLFHSGDNPAFAHPSLDDAGWEQRQVPTGTTPWPFRWHGYGWYRLHVRFDERAVSDDWMLAAGRAREVVELYVNGALVAQRGQFGSRPRGGERTTPLVAFVPGRLLVPGDNVIAARVYDPSWAGGLVAGPVILGTPALVAERLQPDRLGGTAIHFLLAALAVFFGIGQLLMARGRWGSRESFWLAGAGLGLALAHLGSTGALTAFLPALELSLRVPALGAAAAVFCVAGFFATRYDDTAAPHVLWARIAFLVLLATLLLAPDAVAFWVASPLVLVAALLAVMYAAYLLGQAMRRQEPYTVLIFASVILLALLLVYDGLTAADPSVLPPASLAGAVGVLAVTSFASVRQIMAEHEEAIARVESLQQLLESEQRAGILDATAMSITDTARFFEAVLREAARELSVRRCSLVLARGEELVIAAGVGLPRQTVGMTVARESSIAGWVFTHGVPVTDKTLPPELAVLPRAGQYATPSFISQPIKQGELCIGVLNVSDRFDASEFTAANEQMVAEVARQLALVLTRMGTAALT